MCIIYDFSSIFLFSHKQLKGISVTTFSSQSNEALLSAQYFLMQVRKRNITYAGKFSGIFIIFSGIFIIFFGFFVMFTRIFIIFPGCFHIFSVRKYFNPLNFSHNKR